MVGPPVDPWPIILGIFGFSGLAGTASWIVQVLTVVFAVLFLAAAIPPSPAPRLGHPPSRSLPPDPCASSSSTTKATSAKPPILAIEAEGHEADSVDSGHLALRKLAEESYDLIFLDVRLGREDGLDILKADHEDRPARRGGRLHRLRLGRDRGRGDAARRPSTTSRSRSHPEHLRQVIPESAEGEEAGGEGRRAGEPASPPPAPETDLGTKDPQLQAVYETAFRAAATPATPSSSWGRAAPARASWRAPSTSTQPAQGPAVRHRELPPAFPRNSWRASSSGHVKGLLHRRRERHLGQGRRPPTGGPSSSTRSGSCRWRSSPSCCAFLQEKEYERVGENKPRRADAPHHRRHQPATSPSRSRTGASARTSTTGSTSSPSRCPPSGSARSTWSRSPQSYLRFFARQTGKNVESFSADAIQCLRSYGWPGNLRELRNAIERAAILCNGERVEVADFPENFTALGGELPKVDLGSKATPRGAGAGAHPPHPRPGHPSFDSRPPRSSASIPPPLPETQEAEPVSAQPRPPAPAPNKMRIACFSATPARRLAFGPDRSSDLDASLAPFRRPRGAHGVAPGRGRLRGLALRQAWARR